MDKTTSFIKKTLRLDELPDNFSGEQVLELVALALEASADARSDLDEQRISVLRSTLLSIENTTTDTVAALTARRARINDEDE